MRTHLLPQPLVGTLADRDPDAIGFVELFWVGLVSPLLAVAVGFLYSGWLTAPTEDERGSVSFVLYPLVTGGMTILGLAVYLDLHSRKRPACIAESLRTVLGISTVATIVALAVWACTQAERQHVDYAGELVLFLCLPVLTACTTLLWFTARTLQSSSSRALLLAGFVLATALFELHFEASAASRAEELWFMSHSLLIALALAIQLSVWGAKAFQRT